MYMYYSSKVQTRLSEENLVSTWRPISDPCGRVGSAIACAAPSGVSFSGRVSGLDTFPSLVPRGCGNLLTTIFFGVGLYNVLPFPWVVFSGQVDGK